MNKWTNEGKKAIFLAGSLRGALPGYQSIARPPFQAPADLVELLMANFRDLWEGYLKQACWSVALINFDHMRGTLRSQAK